MKPSRRQILGTGLGAVGAAAAATLRADIQPQRPAGSRSRPANEPFGYCLNTSTIRGNKLGIVEMVGAAAKAGFDGIEP